jgi:beta-mannanase
VTTNAARLGSNTVRRLMPFFALAIGAVASTGFAGAAHAETTTEALKFSAIDDAYSSTGRPTYNFGGSDKLYAGKVDGDTMVSYLKFKVGTLATGATVQSAKVTLTRGERALPSTVKLAKVTDTAWSEKTLTAKNDPALGTVVATVNPKSDAKTVTFDVSSVIKGAGTYTFAVTAPVTNGAAQFRSAEYTSSNAGQPSLDVTVQKTVTPPPPPAECTVDAKLVPSCGVLWGAAAGGFSDVPRDEALKTFEQKTGRTAAIYHTYHKGDELIPTKAEIAMTNDPAKPRTLMLNWKVAYGSTWAKVAAGEMDARIDREAAYLKANFTKPFFLVLHHEPENDVKPTAGSGFTAKDFAAMYRHTILRLRAQGVTNIISTVAYMNYEKWNDSPWWFDLYPGDDVVDWIGVDSYVNAQPGGFHNGDFTYLMNRTTGKSAYPGFYNWATTQHPTKPVMAAEWGVYDEAGGTNHDKAKIYDTVVPNLSKLPAVKAVVYFETAKDQLGHDIRMDDTPEALAAFKKLAANPLFDVKLNK